MSNESTEQLRTVVTDALISMIAAVTGTVPPVDIPPPQFIQGPIDRAVDRISAAITKQAAIVDTAAHEQCQQPQAHPDRCGCVQQGTEQVSSAWLTQLRKEYRLFGEQNAQLAQRCRELEEGIGGEQRARHQAELDCIALRAEPKLMADLLIALGIAGVQVSGVAHGDPWSVRLPGHEVQPPTDAMLDDLRGRGLSIDGNNQYKRDLLDVVVDALSLGYLNTQKPPEGHWANAFWDTGRAEGLRAEQDQERIRDMTRDIVAVGEALGIPGEEQAGGVAEFLEIIKRRHPVAASAQLPDGVTIEKDFLGTVHIKLGDFDFIQIRYDHRYTYNSHQAWVANRIVEAITGKPATEPEFAQAAPLT